MFLQWLPWILGMSRPGKKITRKTIMMNSRMKELELKERSSKSLLANVLDIDDDFRNVSTGGNNAAMTTSLGSQNWFCSTLNSKKLSTTWQICSFDLTVRNSGKIWEYKGRYSISRVQAKFHLKIGSSRFVRIHLVKDNSKDNRYFHRIRGKKSPYRNLPLTCTIL